VQVETLFETAVKILDATVASSEFQVMAFEVTELITSLKAPSLGPSSIPPMPSLIEEPQI